MQNRAARRSSSSAILPCLLGIFSAPGSLLAAQPSLILSSVQRITEGFSSDRRITPCFSPDGAKIAFNGRRGRTPDGRPADVHDALYVIDSDGASLIRLFTGDSPAFDPAFSPDNAHISFNAGPSVYEYNIATDSATRLLADAAPDRAGVAYYPGGGAILYCAESGLKSVELAGLRSPAAPRSPLTARRTVPPPTSSPQSAIRNLQYAISNFPSPSGYSSLHDPAFSRDGKSLAFAWQDTGGNSGVMLIPGLGAKLTSLETLVSTTGACLRPCFSPDGQLLFYVLDSEARYEARVMNLATLAEMALTTADSAELLSLAIASDGRKVAFACRKGNEQDLCTAELQPIDWRLAPGRRKPKTGVRGNTSKPDSTGPKALAPSPDSFAPRVDSLAPRLDSVALAEKPEAPSPDSLSPEFDRDGYRIVIFAGDAQDGKDLLDRLQRLGYTNPENYVTTNPTGRSGLKHNRAPDKALAEIVDLARRYFELTLVPFEDRRLPENSIYVNLP